MHLRARGGERSEGADITRRALCRTLRDQPDALHLLRVLRRGLPHGGDHSTEAITLGPRFELADYRRERTVVTKAELLESWPGFAQAQRPPSPVGAGADQTGREELDPGVRPRAAWAAQEHTLDHETAPHPGALGVPVDVPTVIEPGAGKTR
jgi:hypothetical protein